MKRRLAAAGPLVGFTAALVMIALMGAADTPDEPCPFEQALSNEQRAEPALVLLPQPVYPTPAEVVRQPAPEPEPEATAPPPPQPRTRKVWVCVRAYTPWDAIDSRSPWRDGKTATLVDTRKFPHQWGIAADPRIFPYGTKIIIPGYKPSRHFAADKAWPVDDTGGRIRQWATAYQRGRKDGPLIEVRFIHGSSARKWGEKWLWVEVVE